MRCCYSGIASDRFEWNAHQRNSTLLPCPVPIVHDLALDGGVAALLRSKQSKEPSPGFTRGCARMHVCPSAPAPLQQLHHEWLLGWGLSAPAACAAIKCPCKLQRKCKRLSTQHCGAHVRNKSVSKANDGAACIYTRSRARHVTPAASPAAVRAARAPLARPHTVWSVRPALLSTLMNASSSFQGTSGMGCWK